MSDNRSDQITVPLALRNHAARLQILEAQVGRWVYVLPVAPATEPPNFQPSDPLSPPFLNSWGNVAGQQPFSFRIHPATKVQIRGSIDGGSIPSVVCTLPPGYRPQQAPVVISWTSQDGSLTWNGRVDPSGDVWILSECGCNAAIVTEQETFTGEAVTIGNGASDLLTWDNPSGDALVAFPFAVAPTVFATGVYALTAGIAVGSAMTVGGFYVPVLQMGSLVTTGPPVFAGAGYTSPSTSVAATWKLAAGDALEVTVANFDGASSIDFALNAYLQRIL